MGATGGQAPAAQLARERRDRLFSKLKTIEAAVTFAGSGHAMSLADQ
jgi:hypothetical protein